MPPSLRSTALTLIVFAGAASVASAQTVSPIKATLVASGFTHPLHFIQDPSNTTRQVVVEQGGRVRLLINGVVQATDFLNLSGVVTPNGPGEQGLLGFAFAPDYGTSGRVYASYTNAAGDSVISRFKRSTGNPLTIDLATRFDFVWPGGLAYIDQPFDNHNGGHIAFGPDGYLYVGFGDGGSGDDPGHRAQNPATLLGKMLRLNVSVADGDAEGYDIPAGNPFIGQGGVLPEIWAFGLRNPWRWSFDNTLLGGTGAMIIGDVGQVAWEEVDWQPAGIGGLNYGWRNREGAHNNVTSLPAFSSPLRDPILEYGRTVGRTVVGGYVYHGSALGSTMRGRYIYGDFASQKIWSMGLAINSGEAAGTDIVEHTSTLGTAQAWASFGEDAAGEVYVLAWGSGGLYRLDPITPANTELTQNGSFTLGDPPTNWQTFASPDASYMTSNLSAGVFRFSRKFTAAGVTSQAVVFQQTGFPFPANAPLLASFSIGNSDNVRKRISVLLHDSDFTDLSVCTFWLAANAPLATYSIKSHTTKGWSNGTISFYAASTNAQGNTTGYYLLDNVSLQYVPAQNAAVTECVDPTTPGAPGGADGPELLTNGNFGGGLTSWTTFGQITSQISGGVFEFVKAPGTPAGVILQATSQAMTAGQRLTASFSLGNSSGVRKRVTAILHDADFSDLAACTFWLEAGQALQTYVLKTFATEAWTNATFAIYPSTAGAEQWIRLDNVSLKRTPSAVMTGTQCQEPGFVGDQGWTSSARGGVTVSTGGAANSATNGPALGAAPATSGAGQQTDTGVRSGGRVADVLYRWIGDGFEQSGDPAPAENTPSWVTTGTTSPRTLERGVPIDVANLANGRLTFQSWLTSTDGRALVEVSVDGAAWEAILAVAPSDTWVPVEVDLSAYAGAPVSIRLRLDGGTISNASGQPAWRVSTPARAR